MTQEKTYDLMDLLTRERLISNQKRTGNLRMSLSIEATYENGVLRLSGPLPLEEHTKVQVTIDSLPSRAELTAGILPWSGDPKVLQQIAEDDEFGILGSP